MNLLNSIATIWRDRIAKPRLYRGGFLNPAVRCKWLLADSLHPATIWRRLTATSEAVTHSAVYREYGRSVAQVTLDVVDLWHALGAVDVMLTDRLHSACSSALAPGDYVDTCLPTVIARAFRAEPDYDCTHQRLVSDAAATCGSAVPVYTSGGDILLARVPGRTDIIVALLTPTGEVADQRTVIVNNRLLVVHVTDAEQFLINPFVHVRLVRRPSAQGGLFDADGLDEPMLWDVMGNPVSGTDLPLALLRFGRDPNGLCRCLFGGVPLTVEFIQAVGVVGTRRPINTTPVGRKRRNVNALGSPTN